MDEAQRRQYLQAMGITLWERRDRSPAKAPATVHLSAPAAHTPETEGNLTSAPQSAAPAPQPTIEGQAEPLQLAPWEDVPPPDEAPPWSEEPAWHESGGAIDSVAGLDWQALRERVKNCHACALRSGCTQTVFGVGNTDAELLVIGEAPGADEDRQGEPFVGRAGQLLNAMLLAMGFKREEVFIANVLKCRPPNNRDPRAEEVVQCEPFLLRQIALVRPKVILSVGRISAQNLLKTEIPVGKLRGRVHQFGVQGIPLVVTYHPAYLLRSPEQKGKAWDDLQLALSLLRNVAQ